MVTMSFQETYSLRNTDNPGFWGVKSCISTFCREPRGSGTLQEMLKYKI